MPKANRDIKVSDGIVTLDEFKARASQFLRNLKGRREPLVITQNGRPAAVVLSPAAFEEMRAHQSDLEAIAEGLASARAGHLVEHRKVKAWLESWESEAEQDPPL